MLTCTYHKFLLTTILILACFQVIGYAQDVYEGQVISKTTERAIPGVTVTLLKERTATQTNEQGYFNLASENKALNDTLVFSSVGYQAYRLAVSHYQKKMFILLEPSNTQLNQVDISRKMKVLTLEKFSWSDIKEVHMPGAYSHSTIPFVTRSSFAKLFEAPQANIILESVQIGRRDFDSGNQPLTTTNKFTRFLIHILSVDSNMRGPGLEIFTKEVSLTDNSLMVTIDFSKDQLIIPYAKFFIAVEWLRISYNEIISLAYAPKVAKIRKSGKLLLENVSQYAILYQPFLIGYEQANKAPIWIKIGNTWRSYKDPRHEIALSATIHY
jgi:hypothetical protein